MSDVAAKLFQKMQELSKHSQHIFLDNCPPDLQLQIKKLLTGDHTKNISRYNADHKTLSTNLYSTTKFMQSSTTLAPVADKIKATKNLGDLSQLVMNCQRCPLCKTRTNLVFGAGPNTAKIMIIGEGPGHDEDISGQPFVGRAGKLLRAMLMSISILPETVYITNVVKCRPPKNRNPQPDEIAACNPILIQQIQVLKPLLIVLSGKVALNFFFPEAKAMKDFKQKVLKWHDYSMVAFFHPAYILRNRSKLDEVWQDLKFLRSQILDLRS